MVGAVGQPSLPPQTLVGKGYARLRCHNLQVATVVARTLARVLQHIHLRPYGGWAVDEAIESLLGAPSPGREVRGAMGMDPTHPPPN